ncbi:MAG: GtrA family protein [Lachnospiraceae bacterium]|nr:GtrA family protein [Lachnospiraceae bacterium]
MIRKIKFTPAMIETVLYAISGALTTLVNFAVSYLLYNILGINENITNAVAWITAILFAFFSAHIFVFKTSKKEYAAVISPIKRFLYFAAGRVFTLVVELTATYIFVTKLEKDFWLIKVVISVVVIILNYLISKFIVFKKSYDSQEHI